MSFLAKAAVTKSAGLHKKIAIYRDKGVWAAEGSRALPALLDWLGHEWSFISAAEIQQGKLIKQGRPAFDLLIVPGGWAADYIRKLGGFEPTEKDAHKGSKQSPGKRHSKGRGRDRGRGDAEIRRFVRKGAGYLGFCAGAFAAASVTRWNGHDYAYPWKLFPGRAEGPLPWNPLRKQSKLAACHGHAVLNLKAAEFRGRALPAIVRPLLYGGPRFVLDKPAQAPREWRVLARHGEDKTAAIVSYRYGSKHGGHVILCSFHPAVLSSDAGRYDRDKDEFGWAGASKDPDGSVPDWQLSAALVDIALGIKPRPAPAMK